MMEVHNFDSVDPGMRNLKKPPLNFGKKTKIVLNDEQRKEILEIAYKSNYQHGLIIALGLNTGLRVNELANLIISNFNPYSYTIIVQDREASNYAKSFKAKTPNSNRIIPITKELSGKLKAHIGSRKTGYIFRSQRSPMFRKRSLINMINKYANRCNSIPYLYQDAYGVSKKNIGFHCLRATFCSFLVSKKKDIMEIQKLMGHEYVDTTFRYIKQISPIDFKDIRKAMRGMNK
ncbi:tyrosine-type recombinase/integrase [Candidatus Lokiarchaeum ossiferum]|uniref:tyrosine-type recombinase/integrase n=1 Tax=Candidatus Lokiarchaeum ossiferum TaxID=2951803 RepID=UPI00352D52E1